MYLYLTYQHVLSILYCAVHVVWLTVSMWYMCCVVCVLCGTGREVFGMPQKFGQPSLKVSGDTLHGSLSYSGLPVAVGTMAYKSSQWKFDEALDFIQVS